jgi:hypothetical protein
VNFTTKLAVPSNEFNGAVYFDVPKEFSPVEVEKTLKC